MAASCPMPPARRPGCSTCPPPRSAAAPGATERGRFPARNGSMLADGFFSPGSRCRQRPTARAVAEGAHMTAASLSPRVGGCLPRRSWGLASPGAHTRRGSAPGGGLVPFLRQRAALGWCRLRKRHQPVVRPMRQHGLRPSCGFPRTPKGGPRHGAGCHAAEALQHPPHSATTVGAAVHNPPADESCDLHVCRTRGAAAAAGSGT